ncbi:MAG TPA: hypothetical protein VJV79_20885 [Polyangiaceae bacterium]|nr:hypothetical protein [Polyangiaceae bacterium]
MSSRLIHSWAASALVAGAVAVACTGTLDVLPSNSSSSSSGASSSSGGMDDSPDAAVEIPFEPVHARVYVAKVKNLLLGLPATEEEIAAVEQDPTALRAMVDAWFVRPEAQAKLGTFFGKAFQQTQISQNDFFDQLSVDNLSNLPMFTQAQESMSRTALKAIADAKPFTDTVTTHTFMMTPTLMSLYLALDQAQVDDAGKQTLSVPLPDGTLSTTQAFWLTYQPPLDPAAMPVVPNPIPLSETIDQASPNFMHFAVAAPFKCSMPQLDETGHVLLDANGNAMKADVTYNQRKYSSVSAAFLGLFGYATRNHLSDPSDPNGAPTLTIPDDVPADKKNLYQYNCNGGTAFTSPNVTAQDVIWRPVTVRVAKSGEKLTPFYDLPTLRSANEIVVRTPRVGYFTTPAFFANWATNNSNQHRDTLNQALIVGVGRSINPVDKGTSTVLDNGKDGQHSDPTSPCYSCHQTMDPMRNIFRQSFTYSYHTQHDPAQVYSTASFDYLGKKAELTSFDDFAKALIEHPLYAGAWAQKLCYYANSSGCSEQDPEFKRVVQAFVDSQYDFHTLLLELFSSPLVTGQTATKTWRDLGETVSISRQDHFCAALTNRLQLATSLCVGITDSTTRIAVTNNIPLDGYLRGAEAPALSTSQTPFYRGATESLCAYAAGLTVDKTKSRYDSTKKDAAITDFVANIMGITSADPNSAIATQLLTEHYDAAIAASAKPTDALKSTFIVACLSPTSVAIGL